MTGDDGLWYSLELTEPLNLIVQLDAKFHDMKGNRSVITIITEGEKSPNMMGFQFEGEGPQGEQLELRDDPGEDVMLAPEDEVQGADIDAPHQDQQGQQVGEAQIVVRPAKDDEIVVNGKTLTPNSSSLASLRAPCSTYGISTSNSRAKCFGRLLQHQKNLEFRTCTQSSC